MNLTSLEYLSLTKLETKGRGQRKSQLKKPKERLKMTKPRKPAKARKKIRKKEQAKLELKIQKKIQQEEVRILSKSRTKRTQKDPTPELILDKNEPYEDLIDIHQKFLLSYSGTSRL